MLDIYIGSSMSSDLAQLNRYNTTKQTSSDSFSPRTKFKISTFKVTRVGWTKSTWCTGQESMTQAVNRCHRILNILEDVELTKIPLPCNRKTWSNSLSSTHNVRVFFKMTPLLRERYVRIRDTSTLLGTFASPRTLKETRRHRPA